MEKCDLLVIGGGCAGISAALAAERDGISNIIIAERDDVPGGILNQCIHHGFGLSMFKSDLTGPQFAEKLIFSLKCSQIKLLTGTTVTKLNKSAAVLAGPWGCREISFRAAILACGCREAPIGSLPVTGTRPSGVFTAGQAQRMINLGKMDVGDDILILGSGDVGMIVARRLKINRKNVIAVLEKESACGGLESNRVSCLEKYGIPLLTNMTVTRIHGAPRIAGVDILSLKTGKTEHIPCRTLITSVGLIPEQELLSFLPEKEKLPENFFLCGNCRRVHSTADSAALDGDAMGKAAAFFLKTGIFPTGSASYETVTKSDGIICLECPHQCILSIKDGTKSGGLCGKYR